MTLYIETNCSYCYRKKLFLNAVPSAQPGESVVAKVVMFSEEWRQEFTAGMRGCDQQGTDIYVWRMAGWGSNINSKFWSFQTYICPFIFKLCGVFPEIWIEARGQRIGYAGVHILLPLCNFYGICGCSMVVLERACCKLNYNLWASFIALKNVIGVSCELEVYTKRAFRIIVVRILHIRRLNMELIIHDKAHTP